MNKIPTFVTCALSVIAVSFAVNSSQSVTFQQWERDNCRHTVGDVFKYDNRYTGKTDYFQLTTLGPDGGLCTYFPTNETSNYFWKYLPDEAAAEAAAEANAALQKLPPTTLAQINHPPSFTPEKTPATGVCLGCKGSQNVGYGTKGQPGSGFDAVSFRMRPMNDKGVSWSKAPMAYYWAFYTYFTNAGNNPFYFGLQPLGEYGKTALFSVFGSGTSSTYEYCKPGADNGPGTSCHIPYDWVVGNDYDFMVTIGETAESGTTWEAHVYDVENKETTFIGSVTVPKSTGIEQGPVVAFDEYFLWFSHPCREQPFSEILFFTPVYYFKGQPHNGRVTSLNLNNNCNARFFSDHSSYVYIQAGYQESPDASKVPDTSTPDSTK